MPRISAIEPGRRRGRLNISVDGEFAAAAGEKTVADLGLAVGQPFTAERLRELTDAEEGRRALEAAVRLLSARPRSSKEIEQRLRARGVDDAVVARTLERLAALDLIDDAEFARQWVQSRSRASPSGSMRLKQELARKGVARDQIDSALAPVGDDEELDLARRALAAKAGAAPGGAVTRQEYQRLVGLLQRRGFRWPTIDAALRERFGRPPADIDER